MLSPAARITARHCRSAARHTQPRSPIAATASSTTCRSYAWSAEQNSSEQRRPRRSSWVEPTSKSREWPRMEIPPFAKRTVFKPAASRGSSVKIAWTDHFLYIEDPLNDRGRRSLKPATMRDSCGCPKCRDASSGQKTFGSIEIPVDIGIADVKPTEEGIHVTFNDEIPRFAQDGNHTTLISWESVDMALKRTSMEKVQLPRQRSVLQRTGVVYWDKAIIDKQVRKIDYEEFMNGEEGLWDVVIDLCRFGIVYLKNVPKDEESIVRVTTRIANIRETFYGRTFDVRAKPDAENVAYTSGYLGLHQDLLYLDRPPKIQVLHCLENGCEGGESLFSDGERAGRLIWPFLASRKMAPLVEHHVPYQYQKHGYHYFSSRYVIDKNETTFAGVYWSPPFQGKYISAVKDIRRWIEPARIFDSLINDERAIHKYKMEPGECVLFDNLRVMHGRTAFDAASGGSRWLKGAYIAAEDFYSKAAHVPEGQAERYRGKQPWHSAFAQGELKKTKWHRELLKKVQALDPEYGTEATERTDDDSGHWRNEHREA